MGDAKIDLDGLPRVQLEEWYCEDHAAQLVALGRSAAFIAKSTLFAASLLTPWLDGEVRCIACRVGPHDTSRHLVKAALVDAEADRAGGTYTTDEFTLVKGPKA